MAKAQRAPSLPERGVGALRNISELVPTLGRLGVRRGCLRMISGRFGELGTAAALRVVLARRV
jgi:hypothetical protein